MASNKLLTFLFIVFFVAGCQESQKEIKTNERIEYQVSLIIILSNFLEKDLSIHEGRISAVLNGPDF